MDRRNFIQHSTLGAMALSLGHRVSHAKDTNKPNILVILTDDQAFRAIGYNNPEVLTPNMDRLAGEGVIFENAYISTPICAASRASLLTGVYPQQNGSVGLSAEGFKKTVIEEGKYRTPAQFLDAQGYKTGFAGKSHLGDPKAYGFQEGEEIKERNDDPSFERAGVFLRERVEDGEPFFFWLATHQPHIPLQPESKWTGLYRDREITIDPNFQESPPEGSLFNQGLPGESYYRDSKLKSNYGETSAGPPRSREEIETFIRGYYATITRLDHQIGELVKILEAGGKLENTAILFLSDNGYLLGNHGLGNKITMHEEAVRVPMFLRWGGLQNKGIRTDELVSSVDLYPTVMDIAGVENPEWLEGKSLLPLCENPDEPLRDYVASECVGVGGEPGQGHRMVRSKEWKYILTGVNEDAVFNEEEDPYEMNNLVGSEENRETLNRMREWMAEWMDRVGDGHARPPKP
ncbi:MAG: sulfatase [Candidatus Omnitrophica bacterium]|nr:sulfatase [Candidatus Omnitrophota bacterium]